MDSIKHKAIMRVVIMTKARSHSNININNLHTKILITSSPRLNISMLIIRPLKFNMWMFITNINNNLIIKIKFLQI